MRRVQCVDESVALLAGAVFTHIDEIAAASVQTYADAQADAAGTADRRRHRLLILLVTGGLDADTLRRAAAEADWPLPETVAAAALGPLPGTPSGSAPALGHGLTHPSGPGPGSAQGSAPGTAFGTVPEGARGPASGAGPAPGPALGQGPGSPSGLAPGAALHPAPGPAPGSTQGPATVAASGPRPGSVPDATPGNTRGPASRTASGPVPGSASAAVPGTDPGRAPPGTERAVPRGDHRPGTGGALRRYRLPEPVLADPEGAEPCLVIPSPHLLLADPRLQRLLRETAAVVGPAVPPAQAGDSLRWARALRASGPAPAPGSAPVTDPSLARLLPADPALVRLMASRHLRPLASLTAKQRDRVAATLPACLQTPHGTAPEIAARLGVHPQTARRRLHQVHRLFGALPADPTPGSRPRQPCEPPPAARWTGHPADRGRARTNAARSGQSRPGSRRTTAGGSGATTNMTGAGPD
ncbi:helix-turn-helix domain-containing protein [Streptomyces collinus]|uniref:helix-turn-helix domain-containing protein n=1 Tax=Streptomyces collinus TaxID=42684 RepID=UPI0036BA43ED